MQSGDNISLLMDLGLTSVQAKVYCSLVEVGRSTITQIAHSSKVARADVYRTMTALQDLSLVEKMIDNPIEFEALPLQDGLSLLLQRKNKENKKLQARAAKLLNVNENKSAKIMLQTLKTQFILIPAKEAAFRRNRKAIEETKESIDVISSWKKTNQALFAWSQEIKEATKRGVKLRIIQEKPDADRLPAFSRLFENTPKIEIRYIPECSPDLTLWDKKEVFLTILPNAKLDQSPMLWSNHSSLVLIMQDYFESKWATAKAANNL
jgi:sugar-specific transcriptional regulator TrmB